MHHQFTVLTVCGFSVVIFLTRCNQTWPSLMNWGILSCSLSMNSRREGKWLTSMSLFSMQETSCHDCKLFSCYYFCFMASTLQKYCMYLMSLVLVSIPPYNLVKVEFISSARSVFLVYNLGLGQIHQTYLTNMKTSYENSILSYVLCSNCWLNINVTAQ